MMAIQLDDHEWGSILRPLAGSDELILEPIQHDDASKLDLSSIEGGKGAIQFQWRPPINRVLAGADSSKSLTSALQESESRLRSNKEA